MYDRAGLDCKDVTLPIEAVSEGFLKYKYIN